MPTEFGELRTECLPVRRLSWHKPATDISGSEQTQDSSASTAFILSPGIRRRASNCSTLEYFLCGQRTTAACGSAPVTASHAGKMAGYSTTNNSADESNRLWRTTTERSGGR